MRRICSSPNEKHIAEPVCIRCSVTHYTLQARYVGQTFPLDSLWQHAQAERSPQKGITLHCCIVALLAFTKHPYIVIALADTLYGEACLSKLARTLADP